MVTLMILVGATWMGLYLAKRITRPDPDAGGRGARHRRRAPRPPPRARDVRRVRVARRGLQRDGRRAVGQPAGPRAVDAATSQRQHQEVDVRRRYIETVLERITTGVVSVDAEGRVDAPSTRAAARLLGLDDAVAGQPVAELLGRPDLAPLLRARSRARGARAEDPPAQEIRARARGPRAPPGGAAATRLHGEGGATEGRSWSSTTSRRSSAPRRSRRGARSRGAWRTRSRTR